MSRPDGAFLWGGSAVVGGVVLGGLGGLLARWAMPRMAAEALLTAAVVPLAIPAAAGAARAAFAAGRAGSQAWRRRPGRDSARQRSVGCARGQALVEVAMV